MRIYTLILRNLYNLRRGYLIPSSILLIIILLSRHCHAFLRFLLPLTPDLFRNLFHLLLGKDIFSVEKKYCKQ